MDHKALGYGYGTGGSINTPPHEVAKLVNQINSLPIVQESPLFAPLAQMYADLAGLLVDLQSQVDIGDGTGYTAKNVQDVSIGVDTYLDQPTTLGISSLTDAIKRLILDAYGMTDDLEFGQAIGAGLKDVPKPLISSSAVGDPATALAVSYGWVESLYGADKVVTADIMLIPVQTSLIKPTLVRDGVTVAAPEDAILLKNDINIDSGTVVLMPADFAEVPAGTYIAATKAAMTNTGSVTEAWSIARGHITVVEA